MSLMKLFAPLLVTWAASAAAAPAQTIAGPDPLLQAQFAQPRCWSSAAAAAQWQRAGRQAILQGSPWRAEAATAGPRWDTTGGRCVVDRASGLVWATGAVQDDVLLAQTDRVVTQAREQRLCGHTDWRLPARAELAALVDYRAPRADALPGLASTYRSYWTATVQARPRTDAGRFTVTLASGAVRIAPTNQQHAVLLVRDGACRAFGRAYWW